MFELMWTAMGERVTDLIFRMEQLDQEFVAGSTWADASAKKEEAQAPARHRQRAGGGHPRSQGEVKIETIRNRGERVGRNDPCPCGSGKKYKQCCMRKASPMA